MLRTLVLSVEDHVKYLDGRSGSLLADCLQSECLTLSGTNVFLLDGASGPSQSRGPALIATVCRPELLELGLNKSADARFISCRKVRRRQEAPRWVDSYTVPGQFVGVRYPPDPISDSADSVSGSVEGESSFACRHVCLSGAHCPTVLCHDRTQLSLPFMLLCFERP